MDFFAQLYWLHVWLSLGSFCLNKDDVNAASNAVFALGFILLKKHMSPFIV